MVLSDEEMARPYLSDICNLTLYYIIECTRDKHILYKNRGKEDLREILDESESFVQRVVEAQSCRHLVRCLSPASKLELRVQVRRRASARA